MKTADMDAPELSMPQPTVPTTTPQSVQTTTLGSDGLKLEIPHLNLDAKGQMVILSICVCGVSLFCLEKSTQLALCITKRLNNNQIADPE